MIFKKLVLENIRSYEKMTVNFPRGAVLLAGDIGSGKTSILLGLQFALFGLQPGQKGSSVLRQGTDNAFASLEFEIDDKKVRVERSIKRAKSGSISQDSNVIDIDGQREDLSSSEMKERVITLLNYPKEFIKKSNLLYKFTVYTPQEEMKAIIQERPEIRLDTLRHIFGIDRYKRIKENSGVFLQKIKEAVRIKEVLASEVNLLKEKFNLENEKKISLARESNNLEIEYNSLALEKVKFNENFKLLEKTISEKRKIDSEISEMKIILRSKMENEIKMKRDIAMMQRQICEKIDFSVERLRNVIELFEKHKKMLDNSQNELMRVSSVISGIEARKESSMKLSEKVSSLENCPTCFQKVTGEHKDKISKRTNFELEDFNRELEHKLIEKENLRKDIEKEKELVKGYENDKNNLMQDKIRFEHQRTIETKIKSDAFVLDRTTNEIIEVRRKIEELELKAKNFEKAEEDYKNLEIEYESLVEIIRRKEILLATKKRELELLKVTLEELGFEISKKEKIREEVNYLRELQDWLSDKFISMINLAEKNVMVKLRNDFSEIFSEWFSVLASESLSVRLDEDFTPIIINQDYEIEYDFLSGGERTAVALAYRLALNQVLNSILSSIKTKDIVILDEPTEGFSSDQIDKMRDIFEQLKAEQIILVSHEQKIEGFVDHVIKIRKDGTSRVEVVE